MRECRFSNNNTPFLDERKALLLSNTTPLGQRTAFYGKFQTYYAI